MIDFKLFKKILYGSLVFYVIGLSAGSLQKPVTPDASKEAKALLQLLYDISGKYTLTGQHNYPNTGDRNSQFAAKYAGKLPAIWSTDMGFAEDGDTDSYLARPDIVKESIRQHQMGALVTICWHAVPPTADEPVTFRPPPGVDVPPDSLISVQGQLADQQFLDVLTPGTRLYNRWAKQVDSVAVYLKKLQEAKVPVLWRPYHEMNGSWFWWGGRHGDQGTKALYRQIFDRLVHHHKINNLIWLWSVDRVQRPGMEYSHYFPGIDYLDVVSLDVYGSDFHQTYYDSLEAFAQGKPMVLGEVGNPPSLAILETQPKWAFWVVWAGMVRNTTKKQYHLFDESSRILFLEDPQYGDVTEKYRKQCQMNPLPLKPEGPFNFTGEWFLDEEESQLNGGGTGNIPYKMMIAHDADTLKIKKYTIVEWGDDRINYQDYVTDGREYKMTYWNAPQVTTVKWSNDDSQLTFYSKINFSRGGQPSEMMIDESWSVDSWKRKLVIQQYSKSFRGERNTTLIYTKP